MAILGDMGELGEDQVDMHREVGVYAASRSIDVILCVGELSAYMAEAARFTAPAKEILHFSTKEELMKDLPKFLKKGDNILVKASHFMEFGKILEALQG